MTDEDEEKLEAEIREHYLVWSGGIPPDDDRDVFIYVECSRKVEDELFVYLVLHEWMRESLSHASRRNHGLT